MIVATARGRARHAARRRDRHERAGPRVGVGTADCGPVLFADAEAGVVGAAHAGWKGALTGVLEATIVAMEKLGAHARASAPRSAR